MKKMSFVFFLIIGSILKPLYAQEKQTDKAVVQKVADHIINTASFNFKGIDDGNIYASAAEIPNGVDVRINDKYGEWHYTNNVIDMTMIHWGNFFDEEEYT